MSHCAIAWLENAIHHAHRVFDHATDLAAQQRAEWEVVVLEGWRPQQAGDGDQLVKDHIHPMITRLRRHFDHGGDVSECGLIEWKLNRLATWERHLTTDTTPRAHPRLRL